MYLVSYYVYGNILYNFWRCYSWFRAQLFGEFGSEWYDPYPVLFYNTSLTTDWVILDMGSNCLRSHYNRRGSLYSWSVLREQGKSEGFDSCDRPSNLKLDSNRQFFRPCDREICWMTLQNNRAPLLCYFKLCAAFRSHWWSQTGVTVLKRPIWLKFGAF